MKNLGTYFSRRSKIQNSLALAQKMYKCIPSPLINSYATHAKLCFLFSPSLKSPLWAPFLIELLPIWWSWKGLVKLENVFFSFDFFLAFVLCHPKQIGERKCRRVQSSMASSSSDRQFCVGCVCVLFFPMIPGRYWLGIMEEKQKHVFQKMKC